MLEVETKLCISKQMILEYLAIVLYLVVLLFYASLKVIIPIVALVFFGLEGIYIWYKNRQFSSAITMDRDRWVEVEAKVLSAKVIRCICFSNYKWRQTKDEVYRPEITYEYFNGDENSISNRYAISLDDIDCNFDTTKKEAEKIVKNVKKKRTIKVYYNNNIDISVLSLKQVEGYGISASGLGLLRIKYLGLLLMNLLILIFTYKIYQS